MKSGGCALECVMMILEALDGRFPDVLTLGWFLTSSGGVLSQAQSQFRCLLRNRNLLYIKGHAEEQQEPVASGVHRAVHVDQNPQKLLINSCPMPSLSSQGAV